MSTDSFVVQPRRFPGGSIGQLAVHGTVNDLAMAGAVPRWLSAAFVLEEGFPIAELREIVADMASRGRQGGRADRHRRHQGRAQGRRRRPVHHHRGRRRHPRRARDCRRPVQPGDKVLLSGTMGDHGMAVMLARGDLAIEADIASDTARRQQLVELLLAAAPSTRWMRDATRGGVGTVCNELAQACGSGCCSKRTRSRCAPMVNGACDMLGIDPLYVANEGKFVAVVAPEEAEAGLAALRSHPLGADAAEVGEIVAEPAAIVVLRTAFGGTRIVDMLVGDPLPRIC